jgi:hypothetical protein
MILASFCGVGCSEAEQIYDCTSVCEKYSECVDEDLDQSDCVDRCESNADADKDFEEQASDCEDCIDGESCVDAAVECTTTCAPVIAEST